MAEEENGDDDDMTNGDNGSGGGDVSRDLDTDEHIKDPIEDRRTLAERNERLHDQLKVPYQKKTLVKNFFSNLFQLSL